MTLGKIEPVRRSIGMRKHTKTRKLGLSTETIATLSATQLVEVAGGQKNPHPSASCGTETVCYCHV